MKLNIKDKVKYSSKYLRSIQAPYEMYGYTGTVVEIKENLCPHRVIRIAWDDAIDYVSSCFEMNLTRVDDNEPN